MVVACLTLVGDALPPDVRPPPAMQAESMRAVATSPPFVAARRPSPFIAAVEEGKKEHYSNSISSSLIAASGEDASAHARPGKWPGALRVHAEQQQHQPQPQQHHKRGGRQQRAGGAVRASVNRIGQNSNNDGGDDQAELNGIAAGDAVESSPGGGSNPGRNGEAGTALSRRGGGNGTGAGNGMGGMGGGGNIIATTTSSYNHPYTNTATTVPSSSNSMGAGSGLGGGSGGAGEAGSNVNAEGDTTPLPPLHRSSSSTSTPPPLSTTITALPVTKNGTGSSADLGNRSDGTSGGVEDGYDEVDAINISPSLGGTCC